uniref:ATP-binding protein n=1 Tax=Candidatus Similichlamydia epinepheli TaxID=1903953 RepID=UPI00195E0FA4
MSKTCNGNVCYFSLKDRCFFMPVEASLERFNLVKIKVLSEEVAMCIAAGEVVESPACVVKELVENSLDAGAQSIHLEVCGGGFDVIRVVDDGVGLSQEEAVLCIQRHATSKLNRVEDLDSIKSFGFRGEALAAIASVSCLEIVSSS